MSENDANPTDAPEPPAAAEPEAPAPAPRRTLRERFAGTGDRLYGVRGLIAATLAALIVGGFGGAAIHAAVDDGPHSDRFDRPGGFGRDFGHRFGGGERPGPPGDSSGS